tara:strand:+ start:3824 stop:4759 length:936 start_codon:yes stop_codon:yes gene_type:complete
MVAQQPKVAINSSCLKYEKKQGIQIIYTRKKTKQQFCRNKVRFSKKKTLRKPKIPTVLKIETPKKTVDIIPFYEKCRNSSAAQLKELAYLLNIADSEEVCGLLQLWKTTKPTLTHIKLIANTLGIKIDKYKSKHDDKDAFTHKQQRRLISKIKAIKFKPSFQRWIDMGDDNWLITLLSKILLPDNFTNRAEMDLSEKLYRHYLILLGRETDNVRTSLFTNDDTIVWKHINNKQRLLLKDALKYKFSSCVSKFIFKNRLISITENNAAKKFMPELFCKSSILSRSTQIGDFKIPFDKCLIDDISPSMKKELY